jgi:hypothetical protein
MVTSSQRIFVIFVAYFCRIFPSNGFLVFLLLSEVIKVIHEWKFASHRSWPLSPKE